MMTEIKFLTFFSNLTRKKINLGSAKQSYKVFKMSSFSYDTGLATPSIVSVGFLHIRSLR